MKKKLGLKVLSSLTMTAMLASTLSFASAGPAKVDAVEKTSFASQGGAPIDLGIANDERLIEMLKKEGKIAKDAKPAEAEKALQKYLQNRAAGASKDHGELHGHEKELDSNLKEKLNTTGLVNGKGNKVGQTKGTSVDPVKEEDWSGGQRKDEVLVLLIEYPDFPATNIQPGETDMFYDEYLKEHYTDMIFGDDGYKGPNGENLISVKQYYEQQSGGSYSIGGQVAGWYQAKYPAAYYGGNNASDNDTAPRSLVYEALLAAAQDPDVNLLNYDKEDRYDLDGDGNYREPDGLVDHLMVVHSSVGEEAGGGSLGGDAIWSHRWNLGGVAPITGSPTPEVDYWGVGTMYAYDYTIEPADGAAGVFAHEYGHDLGLPDEYDTIYSSSAGEPVAYWSIMSAGSWAGKVPGTEPTGFSPYAREFLHASMPGSNWLTGTTLHADELTKNGTEVLLDQANSKGTNNDAVKVDLPNKERVINEPAAGAWEYYGGNGDEIDHKMVKEVDLTNASKAVLEYDAWYQIEDNWDYAMVQVSADNGATWKSLSTPNTDSDIVSDGYPAIKENMPGYTGSSNGWIHESLDLSEYAGQKILVQFRYMTDWGTNMDGFFVDNVKVTADSAVLFNDGAEGETTFALNGFEKHEGKTSTKHYYLLEWRSHNGVDEGLKNIRRGASLMTYDSGLVVWYVDEAFDNNWTGVHPGDGFLGVVDADQTINRWSDGALASSRYQVHDAAFNQGKSENMYLDYKSILGSVLTDNATQRTPIFDDSSKYTSPVLPQAGRNITSYGLKFRVLGSSADGTVGKVLIHK